MNMFSKRNAGIIAKDSRPKVQSAKLQWLLVLVLFLLLLANNVFQKPMLAAVLCLYLPFIIPKLRHLSVLVFRSYSLLALWLLFIASFLWSVVPKVSLDLIMVQSAFIIMALFITLHHQVEGFARALRFAAILHLAVVVLFCLADPGQAFYHGELKAFYVNKNNAGVLMALDTLVLFYTPGRTIWHVGLGFIAAGLLVASHSKTNIYAVVVCSLLQLLAGWWSRNFYPNSPYVTIKDVFRSVLYASALLSLVALVVFRDEVLGFAWVNFTKNMLTGRGTLWLEVITHIRGKSLLGIGPGAFWQAEASSEVTKTLVYYQNPQWVEKLASADGSYVDLIASIGFLGLSLFLLTAVDLYRRLFRNWHNETNSLLFVLTTLALIQAGTESTILYSTNILFLVYLLCYLYLAGYQDTSRFFKRLN